MTIIQALAAEVDSLFADGGRIPAANVRQMLKDLLASLHQDYNLDVPANGSTVNIATNYLNTTIRFKGAITDPFTLNIVGDPTKLIPGVSSLALIFPADPGNGQKIVTFQGQIAFRNCGGTAPTFTTRTETTIDMLYWNGETFMGLDNC